MPTCAQHFILGLHAEISGNISSGYPSVLSLHRPSSVADSGLLMPGQIFGGLVGMIGVLRSGGARPCP